MTCPRLQPTMSDCEPTSVAFQSEFMADALALDTVMPGNASKVRLPRGSETVCALSNRAAWRETGSAKVVGHMYAAAQTAVG